MWRARAASEALRPPLCGLHGPELFYFQVTAVPRRSAGIYYERGEREKRLVGLEFSLRRRFGPGRRLRGGKSGFVIDKYRRVSTCKLEFHTENSRQRSNSPRAECIEDLTHRRNTPTRRVDACDKKRRKGERERERERTRAHMHPDGEKLSSPECFERGGICSETFNWPV